MSLPASKQQSVNKNGVTVLSLDDFSKLRQLHLGETAEISSGVSLSMLRQASEALLEIDQSAPSQVTVDNVSVNEITTIHPGQIVKTGEGRFVIVRPLQSLILKHEGARSKAFQDTVDLAMASLSTTSDIAASPIGSSAEPGLPKLDSEIVPSALSSKISQSLGISTHNQGFVVSKKLVLVLLLAFLALVGMTLWSLFSMQSVKSAQSTSSMSRNLEHSTQTNSSAPEKLPAQKEETSSSDPLNLSRFSNKKIAEDKAAEAKPIEKKPELTPIPKDFNPDKVAATSNVPQNKQSATSKKTTKNPTAEQAVGSRTTLSAADRQTILEYKLEARFDRSTARAKLKHFAESFPKGSLARQEVMKSYGEL